MLLAVVLHLFQAEFSIVDAVGWFTSLYSHGAPPVKKIYEFKN
jgi:hypothetical protein